VHHRQGNKNNKSRAPHAGETNQKMSTVASTQLSESLIFNDFLLYLQQNPDAGVPVAAVRALVAVMKRSTSSTMLGLTIELRAAADELKRKASESQDKVTTSISLTAGCELFLRYVTRTGLDFAEDFSDCKRVLIDRGEKFADISMRARKRIAEVGRSFIQDGARVLTHAKSRVVMELLCRAAETKNFSVYVTEGRPECAGYYTARKLSEKGIPVSIVLDSGVAALMDKVDVVLMGAEGVLENGSIVNKLGTYQIALVAKAHDKPFYVAAESYKFARLFPLNQNDLPPSPQRFNPCVFPEFDKEDTFPDSADTSRNPSSDLTPPSLINLLFTDLGPLTPSAVSDELIKLYQ
jgi:translation initiation factor eIF-2B subunit alpha